MLSFWWEVPFRGCRSCSYSGLLFASAALLLTCFRLSRLCMFRENPKIPTSSPPRYDSIRLNTPQSTTPFLTSPATLNHKNLFYYFMLPLSVPSRSSPLPHTSRSPCQPQYLSFRVPSRFPRGGNPSPQFHFRDDNTWRGEASNCLLARGSFWVFGVIWFFFVFPWFWFDLGCNSNYPDSCGRRGQRWHPPSSSPSTSRYSLTLTCFSLP